MNRTLLACGAVLLLLACGEDVDLNRDVPHDAFITGNVQPDAECVIAPDGAQTQSGLFDVSPGFGEIDGSPTGRCDQPYALYLLVDSGLDEVALFQEAEVTLRSMDDERLYFHGLPNPFELTVAGRVDRETGQGVVQVNAIPPDYARYLSTFVGGEVVIAVSLDGQTMAGRVVSTQTFRFPVRICDGCLTLCSADIDGQSLTLEDVVGGHCDDNAGADGRFCIDSDC